MSPDAAHIRVLPESLANKIAAGEVVERPASVVKELVENSIDAGAGVVRVEIEVGGRKLIRVTDDGSGMTSDDALLAIERHATSKISTEEDLFEVHTLGFRGEALPSIAAVSRFELLSRPPDRDEGVRVRMEGPKVMDVEPAGCAPGTVVTVRDLFFNVPARKKFLRSKTTELSNISDVVSRISVAHPDVHFQLSHGGREVIEAPPAGDLSGRLADAFGASVLGSMVEVKARGSAGIKLHGMVSLPEFSRSNASHMYFYVNRRPVRDRMISHALIEAYRNILPKGRYPVVVLFIEIDPGEVDVNVHPTKSEVKFQNAGAIHEAVRSAVLDAFSRKKFQSAPQTPLSSADREERIMTALSRSVEFHSEKDSRERERDRPASEPEPLRKTSPIKPVTSPRPWGYFSELKVLGQLRATFTVCQSPEGLLLIDQHAAHERIAFERLRKEYGHNRVQKQALLFPETIELSLKESSEMERHVETFNKLGFDIEPFGERSWRVISQPAVLTSSDVRALVMDTLETLSSSGGADPLKDHLDNIFARMACHAVVRANRNLTDEEMNALLVSLDNADYPLTCPHGRPICVHITFDELEKLFGRK